VRTNPLATLSLRLTGWHVDTPAPSVPRFVCLAIPHTSNWDGALLLAIAGHLGMPIAWMIKDDWVRGPLAPILRRLGAVAIDRSRSRNVVQQMIDEFARRDRLALVIPPEGTRSRTDYWKSGFYHIALGAGVPVVPGYLDYARRCAGLGPPIELTGDVRADMDAIRAFYTSHPWSALYPDRVGPMRLREEDADHEPPAAP